MTTMSIGAVIVARLDSSRFPKKALRKIGDLRLVEHVITRCLQSKSIGGRVVLATTSRRLDQPLVDFVSSLGVTVYRGHLNDVASRVLEAARANEFDFFARINGDSPLTDPHLLDWACDCVRREPCLDFVTNLAPRSFPYGVAIELIRTSAFAASFRNWAVELGDREHITQVLYRNLKSLKHKNLQCPHGDLSSVRLTVDTEEDARYLEELALRAGLALSELGYHRAAQLGALPDKR